MTTSNLFLQQMLKDIGSHATQGRSTLNWGVVTEARKKRKLREADKPEKSDDLPELPDLDASAPDEKGADKDAPVAPPTDGGSDEQGAPAEDSPPEGEKDASGDETEDVDSVKADAEKAKAELEKAKAEKDQAEQELEQNSYIKLNSTAGTSFLLGKLLDKAFKTNTFDSLASEFVSKLKITNPDDFNTFSSDMVPYKTLVGMPEFLQSVKSLSANAKQSATDGEE